MSDNALDLDQRIARKIMETHNKSLDEVVLSHGLWCPRIEYPEWKSGVIETIVILNDGRRILVQTKLEAVP